MRSTQPGPSSPAPAAPGPRLRDGRGYLGLALLGWGLSILLGITPHEDLLVGAGLSIFGAALVFTAPRLPRFAFLAAWPVALAGLAAAASVLAYDAVMHAALDVPKAAIVALGLGVGAAAPFLHRPVPAWPRRERPQVASVVGCAMLVIAAPMAVWATQGLFKTALGTTPMEAFVRIGLVAPLGIILRLLGIPATTAGQSIAYPTRNGTLVLDVGAACSGIQAMALFAAVLAAYLVAERPGGRRLALWSAIGLGGIYVANLIRLVTVSLVGYQWGADALQRVHAEAGWMFFVAWTLLFAWLSRTRAVARPAKPADPAGP